MRRLLLLAGAVALTPTLALAQSAGSTINNLPASPPIVGTQLTYCPVGSTYDYKCTFSQIAAFVSANLTAGSAAANLGAPLGTSGATIPLNNGSNTESGQWQFNNAAGFATSNSPFSIDTYDKGVPNAVAAYVMGHTDSSALTGLEREGLWLYDISAGTGDGSVPGTTNALVVSSIKTGWNLGTAGAGQNSPSSMLARCGAADNTQSGTLDTTTQVTGLTSTAAIKTGMTVSGFGITAGTKVVSIDSTTSITLSAVSLVSSVQSLTFYFTAYGYGDCASIQANTYQTSAHSIAEFLESITTYSSVGGADPSITAGAISIRNYIGSIRKDQGGGAGQGFYALAAAGTIDAGFLVANIGAYIQPGITNPGAVSYPFRYAHDDGTSVFNAFTVNVNGDITIARAASGNAKTIRVGGSATDNLEFLSDAGALLSSMTNTGAWTFASANVTGNLGLGGSTFAALTGTTTPYFNIYSTAGNIAFLVGGGGGTPDPTTYLRNTNFYFQNIGGGTTYGRWLSTGLSVDNGSVGTKGYTVATLPAHIAGRRAYVTDQLTACVATGAALTGGGAKVCPVFDDGTTWVGD